MNAVAKKNIQSATLEDVQINFRNFAGKPTNFNPNGGKRDFAVFLKPEDALQMARDGWNVKQLKVREEGDIPQDYITVKVNYNGRPPRVVILTSKGKTPLDEGLIEILDWADILSCDVTIRPYHYDVNGSQGVSAYLQSIYVKIQEDYLDQKYDSVPYVEGAAPQLAIEGDDGIEDAEIVYDEEGPLEIGR